MILNLFNLTRLKVIKCFLYGERVPVPLSLACVDCQVTFEKGGIKHGFLLR